MEVWVALQNIGNTYKIAVFEGNTNIVQRKRTQTDLRGSILTKGGEAGNMNMITCGSIQCYVY